MAAGNCPTASCADPVSFDTAGWEILPLAYDGLVDYRRAAGAAGDTLVPALATDIPTPQDDGRTYVFTLRPGLRFSDGRPVRPLDVRASLERALRLSGQFISGWYSAIVGVPTCLHAPTRCDLSRGIAVDAASRTVTIHLRHPDPELLYKLAEPTADVVPADSPSQLVTAVPLPGTGPYRFVATDELGNARLLRNRYFRSFSSDARPDGLADEIVISRNDDLASRVRAVAAGDADLVDVTEGPHPRSAALLAGLQTRYAGRLSVTPLLSVDFMFLNVRVPPFDDVRVRRAVNLAADRARLVELRGGPAFAEPSCQTMPSALPGYTQRCPFTVAANAVGTWYGPDVPKARRLIAASGTEGARVRVWTDTDKVVYGRYFLGLLRRLGYRTTLKIVPVGMEYFNAVGDSRNRAQIGMFGWLADFPTPVTFFDPFKCSGPMVSLNLSQLCDRRLDRAVARARRAGNSAAAWAPAERRLLELAPSVPLFNRRRIMFASARAGNVQQHPMWGTLLERVWVR